MFKPTIFIDESGTLPDPKDKVILIAAVGVDQSRKLASIFKSIHKMRDLKEKQTELKFYKSGLKTKDLFFKALTKIEISIFLLIVDKMGKKIPDSPQHFAILNFLLLSEILHFYPEVEKVVFDRHFHKDKDLELFNKTIIKLLGEQKVNILHVNSQENKLVNVADMIAGATLAKESGKNPSFYETFKDKIVTETKINWPEAKRRLFY